MSVKKVQAEKSIHHMKYKSNCNFTWWLITITILCIKQSMANMGEIRSRPIDSQISIACWNSRGLCTSLPYLHKLLQHNDIIALSEHWLHANRLNILNDISDEFNVIARSSKLSDSGDYGSRRGQGGVRLMWRKSLGDVSPITSLIHDRICGIRLQCSTGRVINVLSVYMPAPGSSDEYNVVLDDLSEAIDSMDTGSLTIACGDFNGDVGFLGGPRSNRKPTTLGRRIMAFFKEYSLTPINMLADTKGPINTFRGGMGSSTIDYIAVPQGLIESVKACEVLEDAILNTSDHNAIHLTLDCSGLRVAYTKSGCIPKVKWSKLTKLEVFNEYTAPVDRFCESILQDTDFHELGPREIDDLIDTVTSNLVESANNLPRVRYRKHVRPYWNGVLTELKRVKVTAFRIWTSEGRPRDPNSVSLINHKNAKRNFRRELKKVQRNYDQKQIR